MADKKRDARTALITGASRGLGLALARALAQSGWRLVLDARGRDALETVRAELCRVTEVITIAGDVSDPAHRAALAAAARDFGGLDALVNNASILGASPLPTLLNYPTEVLEQVYRVNVFAPLALLQAVQGVLRPGARIVNVTDATPPWKPTPAGAGTDQARQPWDSGRPVLAVERPDLKVFRVAPWRHAHSDASGSVSRRGHLRPTTSRCECAWPAGVADRRLPERPLQRA